MAKKIAPKSAAKKAAKAPAAKKAAAKKTAAARKAAPAPSQPATSGAGWADHLAKSPVWSRVDPELRARLEGRRPAKAQLDRAAKIADLLEREFPEATCALTHESPLQLLVATILSAQCTDERVNMVTPALFAKYPTALDFANAPAGELEKDIHSTGFYNNKAKAIRAACADIAGRFGGQVPRAMDELLTLRGVARKTANVVRTNCFGDPGLTVDTHFTRLSNRLGLTESEDPEKIEADVASLLSPERWTLFCHAIILHGRKTCKARGPKCGECALAKLCPSAFKAE